MDICLVLFSYGVWGGGEVLTSGLARHLRDKGENVTLVLNDEVFKYYTDLEGVELINVGPMTPLPGWTKRPFLYRIVCFPYVRLSSFFYYRRIQKRMEFLRDRHFDVINPILEIAAPLVVDLMEKRKIPRVPVVSMIVGEPHLRGIDPTPLRQRLFTRQVANKFKQALRKSERVIAMSNFIIRAWEDQGVRLGDKAVAIIGGRDLMQVSLTQTATYNHKGEFSLIFPGGARFIKGGDLLIKSLPKVKKEIPNIKIYIASDVPKNSLLRKMVNDLDLEQNVTFVGLLPSKEYLTLLNSVDVLILPSRGDALAGVFIEAMALGKPIIATNTGGTPEIIKEGRNGVLVEPEPDQIAGAILYLYRNEDLRKKIGQNNIADQLKYDWSTVTDQYIEVYEQAIKGFTL
jgi:glycosyltransferase involved in cell wall biosynthesis